MQELGFDAYVLDDAQQQPNSGEWELVYVPTVNGMPSFQHPGESR